MGVGTNHVALLESSLRAFVLAALPSGGFVNVAFINKVLGVNLRMALDEIDEMFYGGAHKLFSNLSLPNIHF